MDLLFIHFQDLTDRVVETHLWIPGPRSQEAKGGLSHSWEDDLSCKAQMGGGLTSDTPKGGMPVVDSSVGNGSCGQRLNLGHLSLPTMVCTLICHIYISHLSDFPQWTANSSGSAPNTAEDRFLGLCQVLPVSDHYLVFHFQLKLGDWFFTCSPGPAFKTTNLIRSFIMSFGSSNGSFLPTLKV